MTRADDHETVILDVLKRAVTVALERKRRLGQYAVVWRNGRAVCIGPDAPPMHDPYGAQETTQKATQKTTPISARHQLASLILARPDISQQELAVALGLTRDGVKYHINKMKHDGVIRHAGPTRGGRWKVLK